MIRTLYYEYATEYALSSSPHWRYRGELEMRQRLIMHDTSVIMPVRIYAILTHKHSVSI